MCELFRYDKFDSYICFNRSISSSLVSEISESFETVRLDKTMIQVLSWTATVNKVSFIIQQNVWRPRLNLTWTTYME